MMWALFFTSISSGKEGMPMFARIKKWLKRHIDYRIVDEYYDTNGDGHYYKKYIRKYYFKK